MITIIAAVAKNRVIGDSTTNQIPWHLPEDFKHFKQTTEGHTVIMGTRTWESLPPKFRPLPNRYNIVVSRDRWDGKGVNGSNLCFMSSIEKALDYRLFSADNLNKRVLPLGTEQFIIGGASIYEQTMDVAERLIISHVDMEPEGDTLFPEIDPDVWEPVSEVPHEGFVIVEYHRKA